MKPTIPRPARVLTAGLIAAGSVVFPAAPSAFAADTSTVPSSATAPEPPERSSGGSSTFDGALAEPGATTTFYRDTLWQLTLPAGFTVHTTQEGGIQFVDARGTVTARYAPTSVTDTSGTRHPITWTLNGTTIHQHVDITAGSVQGHPDLALSPQSRGFWDCVGETGKAGMVGGAVTGCVAGAETGCAPGAVVGGFAGGLGGVATGLFKC